MRPFAKKIELRPLPPIPISINTKKIILICLLEKVEEGLFCPPLTLHLLKNGVLFIEFAYWALNLVINSVVLCFENESSALKMRVHPLAAFNSDGSEKGGEGEEGGKQKKR